jgi:hypothetical protein
MSVRRVAPLLLATLWLLTSGSAPVHSQEVETPDATCTAWMLDMTNHSGLEVQVYEYRGEVSAVRIEQRLKGHLIRVVPPRVRTSTPLFGARPAVMIYAFQEATNARFRVVVDSTGTPRYEQVAPDRPERLRLLGVAWPHAQRESGGREVPSLRRGLVLRFTCASNQAA